MAYTCLCFLRDGIYRVQVGALSDVYLFELTSHPKRATTPLADKSARISEEDGVSAR